MNTKHHVHIYGTSDDLVEIEGDVREEFDSYNKPTFLLFNDGSQIEVRYNNEGLWRVNRIKAGYAEVEHQTAPEGNPECGYLVHANKNVPVYSDLLMLEWDKPFELVKRGHRQIKVSAKGSEDSDSQMKAEKVIEYLSDKTGFDDCWYDLDPDEQNEIMDGLADIIGKGRKTDGGKKGVLCFTGTLSISRADAKTLSEKAGFGVSSNLVSGVGYLVVGEDAGSKLGKAKKLGITILGESQWLELIRPHVPEDVWRALTPA